MTPPGIDPATFRFVAQYLNHLESGSLNLLELSGSVKACNRIAIPLPFTSTNHSDLKTYSEIEE
jgi:hypothetical protein